MNKYKNGGINMQLRKMCAPPTTNKIVFSHEYAEKEGPFARGKEGANG